MLGATPISDPASRPSRVIAEALVGRYGPRQIAEVSTSLGFPEQLTRAILAACTATACDTAWTRKKSPVAVR